MAKQIQGVGDSGVVSDVSKNIYKYSDWISSWIYSPHAGCRAFNNILYNVLKNLVT
jgi:hypothetical protein